MRLLDNFKEKGVGGLDLKREEVASILYHGLFDFPLTLSDLIRWQAGEKLEVLGKDISIKKKDGFYFLKGKEGMVYKRLMRERSSKKKMDIAQKASFLLSFVPGIKMVGISGALAMENAGDNSDIDLVIVTKNKRLWTTRALTLFSLKLFGFKIRRAGNKEEKDKLCLNIWLDENDLAWKKRNIYTAHEIAQIVPLINKDETHEKLIWRNKWLKDYWPNAVRVRETKNKTTPNRDSLLEALARKAQYWYMKKKITREVVTPTRALFHPNDWSALVLQRINAEKLLSS